jgi:hypothetical protein
MPYTVIPLRPPTLEPGFYSLGSRCGGRLPRPVLFWIFVEEAAFKFYPNRNLDHEFA